MRYYTVTMCIIAGLLLLGCVPSIHPLFTADDLAYDPDLVGTWKPEKSKESICFTKAPDTGYRMVHTDGDGKVGKFRVHLTKIDGQLFFDFSPDEEADLPHTDFFKVHLIPAHTFSLVHEISPKSLQFSLLNPEWLSEYLEENPDALKHERRDDKSLVLTAATKDLRKFFAQNVNTPKAFAERSKFIRAEEGGAPEGETKAKPKEEPKEEPKDEPRERPKEAATEAAKEVPKETPP
jgi:hypothetical protein